MQNKINQGIFWSSCNLYVNGEQAKAWKALSQDLRYSSLSLTIKLSDHAGTDHALVLDDYAVC